MDSKTTEELFKKLPQHQKELPSNAQLGRQERVISVNVDELGIDTTKQKLRFMRPFGKAVASIPQTLSPNAQIALQALLACFERQKSVKEGVFKDILWGFAQVGLPADVVGKGLWDLKELGYISFQAPDGTPLGKEAHGLAEAWVRYEKKLLDLVYD